MPNPGLDLDDIQLPEADAEKPHGSDVTPLTPEQEEEQKKIQADQKAKEEADAGAAKEKEEAEAAKGKSPEEIAADEKAAADAKEDEEKDKATPFHEHPDWKKMQERVEAAETRVRELTAKPEVTDDKKEEARKSADEKLQADLGAGWKPTSQAELMIRGLKYMREDLEGKIEDKEKEKAEAIQTQDDENRSIASLAVVTYDEIGIKEIDQRREVGKYLAELQQQGIIAPISSKNIQTAIKWAAEQLKTAGKLTTPAPAADADPEAKKDPPEEKKEIKTEETPEQKTARETAEQKKKDVNAKITKPTQDATPPDKKPKKSYAQMHGTSLDEITFNAGKDLI